MTTAWLGIAAPWLAGILIVLAPGLVATAPIGVRGLGRFAVSGVAGVFCLGVAGVTFSLAGVAFAPWQSLVVALVIGAIAAVARRFSRGDWMPRSRAPRRRALGAIGAAWLAASVLVALVAFWGVASPESFSQTYDNVFHLSAIAHILQSGDASSLTLRTMIETGKSFAFYPSGWHSLVAAIVMVSGSSVAVASNAAWLVVAATIWLPGAAWLAQLVLGGFSATRVAVTALPIAAGFGAFPYALLAWGTLYPTFVATALVPGTLALFVLAGRELVAIGGHRPWRRLLALAGPVLGMGAVAFGQPRVLATLAVLLLPLVAWRVARLARREWNYGGTRRRRVRLAGIGAVVFAGIAAAAAFWYLVARLGLFTRPLDDRLGGPQAKAVQSVWSGLGQVLAQSWLVGEGARSTWPALLLALAVIAGGIAAWRLPRLRWLVVSYAALALLFALAAGSDDVVTKLATGIWYKDRYRLSSGLPVIGVVLATLGVLAVLRFVHARRTARASAVGASLPLARTWPAAVVAGLVALTSAAALIGGGMSGAIARVFTTPEAHATTEIASRAQLAFLRSVADVVPERERILADPWGGSTLVWIEAGREPVFPHVNGQWDPDRLALAFRLPEIATDPTVCDALNHLRVRYVLYNAHELAGGDPAGNLFPGPNAAVRAGLFTEVLTDGETSLYRIDQCGPLP